MSGALLSCPAEPRLLSFCFYHCGFCYESPGPCLSAVTGEMEGAGARNGGDRVR